MITLFSGRLGRTRFDAFPIFLFKIVEAMIDENDLIFAMGYSWLINNKAVSAIPT
jgi:hypothetical protein